ncbi:nudC domain-containing protein 3 [Fopius arisanus]|uniref:NudC domain-containing protein 3 n=2 Tax=Fopius arisanus TaxID=64838 RepID=A0A9R1U826_9HYME|nr:PREDICTED: nudC domain-containing protein 3-like [Fopius arisanus]
MNLASLVDKNNNSFMRMASNQSSDNYNGAEHENFSWSQSINDLDVIVKIPDGLKCLDDLKIHVSTRGIKVEARTRNFRAGDQDSDWCVIFQGELSYEIKSSESIWTAIPGKYVHIHLEKSSERWWESLINDEAKISLDKIDCSRDIEELNPQEQMTLQELMWCEHEKNLKRLEKVKEQ